MFGNGRWELTCELKAVGMDNREGMSKRRDNILQRMASQEGLQLHSAWKLEKQNEIKVDSFII